jgi:hypothetical protein
MSAPVKHIMDDLQFIGDELRDAGRLEDALNIGHLIESADRAGHEVYTWEGVTEEVRRNLLHMSFDEDVLDLINAALTRPRGM